MGVLNSATFKHFLFWFSNSIHQIWEFFHNCQRISSFNHSNCSCVWDNNNRWGLCWQRLRLSWLFHLLLIGVDYLAWSNSIIINICWNKSWIHDISKIYGLVLGLCGWLFSLFELLEGPQLEGSNSDGQATPCQNDIVLPTATINLEGAQFHGNLCAFRHFLLSRSVVYNCKKTML